MPDLSSDEHLSVAQDKLVWYMEAHVLHRANFLMFLSTVFII